MRDRLVQKCRESVVFSWCLVILGIVFMLLIVKI